MSLQVWRVRWNVTGTVLASSGDDGCVRLWRGTYKLVLQNTKVIVVGNSNSYCTANYLENWKCTAVLKGDAHVVSPLATRPSLTTSTLGSASASASASTNPQW